MSFEPDRPIDILVCYGRERGTKYPHWMLMLVSRGAQSGTWYHSTGGPTQNRPYRVDIEANKRLNSFGISTTETIGSIDPKDINKVKAAAQRVPAQQCQRYVVALVYELEQKGFVHQGQAVRLNQNVQMSEGAQAYAAQNPVEHPSGAYVPPRVQGPSTAHQPRPRPQKKAKKKIRCVIM